MRAGNGADVSARTSGVYDVALEQPRGSISPRGGHERRPARPRGITCLTRSRRSARRPPSNQIRPRLNIRDRKRVSVQCDVRPKVGEYAERIEFDESARVTLTALALPELALADVLAAAKFPAVAVIGPPT